jgi:hypothetical protein
MKSRSKRYFVRKSKAFQLAMLAMINEISIRKTQPLPSYPKGTTETTGILTINEFSGFTKKTLYDIREAFNAPSKLMQNTL